VGRGTLVAALAAAFDRMERLVTLIGTGGAGKTHLASFYAHSTLGRRCQDVRFCHLSRATKAPDIIAIVKSTLGLPGWATESTSEVATRLGIALGERGPLLLVLDNFEHLTGYATDTVGRWLELSTEVSFLVTSRQRLHLISECVIEVGPLAEDAAIELLARRARAIDGCFRIEEHDRHSVVAIVRRLDALPLAIEIAAPGAACQGRGLEKMAGERVFSVKHTANAALRGGRP